MDSLNDIDYNGQMKQSIDSDEHHRHRALWFNRECIICGSKAIGMNFGAPTCAPCKAFFRRNARRKEILESPCHHPEKNFSKENTDIDEKTIRYLQIRRCTSCRLRRCFDIGMKEELIRTDEENQRHKQLVSINRKRRELLKQQQPTSQLVIPQATMNNKVLLNEIDWCHLSNIVYAYDTHCLKTYVEQRGKMLFYGISEHERTIEDYSVFPISVTLSISAFARSLPAFQSLSRSVQNFLCENNLRRLIFMNLHELNQSCFSESWQIAIYRTGWELLCGRELYKQFQYIENLSEKLIIADPIVTRLWLVTLFFSTPLFSYYDPKLPVIKTKKKLPSIDIQNAYVTLLWKYLLYRHGYMESVRIYSNLIQVYLHMLRVGIEINLRFRAHMDLKMIHETLEKIATIDIQ
jgi:hypothetical protein